MITVIAVFNFKNILRLFSISVNNL